MNESSHTQTPWIVDIENGRPTGRIMSPSQALWIADVRCFPHRWRRAVGKVPAGEWEANAEFIVRCVNAHHDLLETYRLVT